MGRRSVSSTKTGKFMNPTDQARKEARRKELKKNKKQRLLVRHAVLKGKDPKLILNELEQVDQMEYDVNNPPQFNAKVLQDKRRKLKETWHKVFKLYERDDPKLASEIKFMEIEYEKRRFQMMSVYESIKQAEKVKLEDIPLPDMSDGPMPPSDIPLPISQSVLSAGPIINQATLKHRSILKSKFDSNVKRDPPGPPPGPPPNLAEFECVDDEKELGISADDNLKNKPKKIRFADDSETPSAKETASIPVPSYASTIKSVPPPLPLISTGYGANRMYAQQQNMLESTHRMQPPQQQQQQMQQQQQSRSNIPKQNVFSAPPVRSSATSVTTKPNDGSSTIEAKPMLRNKMAEITRFVPTTLVVRRDQKSKTSYTHDTYQYNPQSTTNLPAYISSSTFESNKQQQHQQQQPKGTKDEAYESFMKEINKLL